VRGSTAACAWLAVPPGFLLTVCRLAQKNLQRHRGIEQTNIGLIGPPRLAQEFDGEQCASLKARSVCLVEFEGLAAKQVRNSVSKLRRALSGAGAGDMIATVPGGYKLAADGPPDLNLVLTRAITKEGPGHTPARQTRPQARR